MQLRRIVDQLIFWALRIFKPWVTGCLEQWYGEGIEEGEEDGEEDGEEEGAEGREDKYELICPIKSNILIYGNAEQLDQQGSTDSNAGRQRRFFIIPE